MRNQASTRKPRIFQAQWGSPREGGPPAIFEEKWGCSAPLRPGLWVQEAFLCCFGAGIPRAQECVCLLSLLFLLFRLARPDLKRKLTLPTILAAKYRLAGFLDAFQWQQGGLGKTLERVL